MGALLTDNVPMRWLTRTIAWLTVGSAKRAQAQTSARWLTTNERKESMCFQLRDAMRVGNICFSNEFFSTTQSVREVKQTLEDELVRRHPNPLLAIVPPSVWRCGRARPSQPCMLLTRPVCTLAALKNPVWKV